MLVSYERRIPVVAAVFGKSRIHRTRVVNSSQVGYPWLLLYTCSRIDPLSLLRREHQKLIRSRKMGTLDSTLFPIALVSLLCLQSTTSLPSSQPLPLQSLKKIKPNLQSASSCPYTVIISTSCSSVSYTRDQISLAFGDAYGNQVYVPRLDDPSSHTFERCSRDTFNIYGPCTYDICYVYLYRRGYDGWKPQTVQIYGRYTKAVTFNYNTFIPNDVWWGFNYCHGAGASVLPRST